MAIECVLSTWHPKSNQTTSKMTSVLILLLLLLGDSTFATAKFINDPNLLSRPNRGFLDSKQKHKSLVIELMHSHHEDLPYVMANITLPKRVELLGRSSEERLNYLADNIFGNDTTFGMENSVEHDYHLDAPKVFQDAYVVALPIGTPTRQVIVELDNTIALTWLHCPPCDKCFEFVPNKQPKKLELIYDPTKSSSITNITCHESYCQTYGEVMMDCSEDKPSLCRYKYGPVDRRNTWELEGYLAKDEISFHNEEEHSYDVGFGCGYGNKGIFRHTSGVLGLGRGVLALYSQINMTVFSYCFVDFHSMRTKKSSLIFGDEHVKDVEDPTTKYTWILRGRLKNRKQMFYVKMVAILINQKPLILPNAAFTVTNDNTGGLVVDTITTFSYFNSVIYDVLKRIIMQALQPYRLIIPHKGFPLPLCYIIGQHAPPYNMFPNVTLQFDGTVFMHLHPENVFLTKQGKTSHVACLAIKENLKSKDTTLNVLGTFQQQNFRVITNVGTGKIAFVPQSCPQGPRD